MASLPALPTELLDMVVGELEFASDVSSFARSSRRLYHIANPLLYRYYGTRYSHKGLIAAVEKGNLSAVRMLLSVGAQRRHYTPDPVVVNRRTWTPGHSRGVDQGLGYPAENMGQCLDVIS